MVEHLPQNNSMNTHQHISQNKKREGRNDTANNGNLNSFHKQKSYAEEQRTTLLVEGKVILTCTELGKLNKKENNYGMNIHRTISAINYMNYIMPVLHKYQRIYKYAKSS